MVPFEKGQKLLRDRYTLIKQKTLFDGRSESWLALDNDEYDYLIRLWTFDSETPDDLQRALWDNELRTIYRLGSSPGAEEFLLVIRDAGIDLAARCFVMVLKAPGYDMLSEALKRRKEHDWLLTREPRPRSLVWQGLLNLANGLKLLHDRHIIHRNIDAETVFFDESREAASFRLGGFEWSVRLGVPAASKPPINWASPPEFYPENVLGYTMEGDWYGFGMLAVRCLLNVEKYNDQNPVERQEAMIKEIDKATNKNLSDSEKIFLKRLIDSKPSARLKNSSEIFRTMESIIQNLDYGTNPQIDEHNSLSIIVLPNNPGLIDYFEEKGFKANPDESFSQYKLSHLIKLKEFIEDDLNKEGTQLHVVLNQNFYVLVGQELILTLREFSYVDRNSGQEISTWEYAFCSGFGELRGSSGDSQHRELPRNSIVVRTSKGEAIKDIGHFLNWKAFLPTFDKVAHQRRKLELFYDFVRCTNQLEILLRDSEIFPYEVISRETDSEKERVVIREDTDNKPQPLDFFNISGGMVEHLTREMESGKPECHRVTWIQADNYLETRSKEDDLNAMWEIQDIDLINKKVTLVRDALSHNKKLPLPDKAYLRTYGTRGQLFLIYRRKKAIDRLEKHSYLLRAFSETHDVYMDTGDTPLPIAIPPDEVDEAKRNAMKNIMRVRPIYALQGPPGTGKTTLVSHLLRQILKDDPVAQILVTAQAHGAVDVLMEKVGKVFENVPDKDKPLDVRLGDDLSSENSVHAVSLRVLNSAKNELSGISQLSDLQREWLSAADKMISALKTKSPETDSRDTSGSADFRELVKIGANITYCTTSSGDLEAIAESTQMFDWSIIEEAGKVHGSDLALPLQAGHRWLLIGDHKQLPPYRVEDYKKGVERLNEVIEKLEELPKSARYLLDNDWIRKWKNDFDEKAREDFKKYAQDRLKTFKYIFEACEGVIGDDSDSKAPPYGMLSRQHRMHPTIGTLVSEAFYEGKLKNETVDETGEPKSKVLHPFILPAGIEKKAIVWINMPWAKKDGLFKEDDNPRYTNNKEIEAFECFLKQLGRSLGTDGMFNEPLSFAILSPYSQQVKEIRKHSKNINQYLSEVGLKPKQDLKGSKSGGISSGVYTVDSFQGNEADIVAVSLVRNNCSLPRKGLGFLDEVPRINVILSRAERLLILVGSWEFFNYQVEGVKIDNKAEPLWEWKKILHTLDTWFDSGLAMKIEFDDILED